MTRQTPHWSIVVPTYGRGAALPGLLDALCVMQAPTGGFEVVLVDDGGPEPLDTIVEPFMGRLDLKLYRKTNGGPASARNFGVAQARGEWIALTDDDCRPHAEWLVQLAAAAAVDPQAMIGGQTDNGLSDNLFSESSQLLVDYLYARGQGVAGRLDFITSNNMALSRAGFLAIGGFDEHFPLAAGEDRDFCDRWRDADGAIVFEPAARIDHFHTLDARGFWRQHRNYGRGAVRVHDQRTAASTAGSRFERLSFYAGLVAYPVTAGERQPWRKSALLAVSQAATTAGYLGELVARKRRG
ncbi:glycosyltransferase family A protein [Salinisphaera sp. SPP-AMP-43]|uniref:glycosyltransferase family 2 protein n=1 Tax=Salinisphaera sp. SPP-AMP-43 TaxID=3121288 RepID=UPI003C6E7FC3